MNSRRVLLLVAPPLFVAGLVVGRQGAAGIAEEGEILGLNPVGLETQDMDPLIACLREGNISSTDSQISPFTRVRLAHATDPEGVHFELIEALEGSDLRRVMEDWESPFPVRSWSVGRGS